MARARSARSSRRSDRGARADEHRTDDARAARLRTAGWAGFLCLLCLMAYGPVFGHDFVAFDDLPYVRLFPDYNPPTLAKLAHFWTEPYPDMYTPVLWTVWGLLAFVARSETPAGEVVWDATPYHAFNLAAHAGASVVALLVLRRLVRSDRAAFFGAAAFALHPLQVEAVAWVSGMKTPLSGLFALWAVWHFLRFTELRHGAEGERIVESRGVRRAWLHYALASVAFVLGMITKPTVVVLPLIIGAIEWLLRGRRVRDLVLPLVPWLAVAVLLSMLNVGAQPAETVFRPAAWQRPLVALGSLSFYLWKLVLPYPLLPDYSRSPDVVTQGPWLWIGAAPAAVLILAAVVLRRRKPWFTVAAATFVLGAVTTLGLITYDYQVYSTVADRYAYLSVFGAAVAMTYVLHGITQPARGARAVPVAAGVVGICAVLTFAQCLRWRDSDTLFGYTLRHNPRSLIAYRSLAFQADLRGRPDETLEISRRGLEARPGDPILLQRVANDAGRRERFDEAIATFKDALSRPAPNRHELLNGLGISLAQAKRPEEAERAWRESIDIEPKFTAAYENLAVLYAQAGRFDEAVRVLDQAVKIDPRAEKAAALLPQVRAMRENAGRVPQTRGAATAPVGR